MLYFVVYNVSYSKPIFKTTFYDTIIGFIAKYHINGFSNSIKGQYIIARSVNTSCGDRKEVTPNLAQYVAFITIHVPLGLVRNDHSSVLGNVECVLTHSLSLFLAGFSSTVTVDLFASVFQPGGSSHMRNRAQLV